MEFSANFKKYLSTNTFALFDVYFGSVTGDVVPLQEAIFAGGFVDPKHETFVPARRGDNSYLRTFGSGKPGMNMYGYAEYKRSYKSGKAGLSNGLMLQFPFHFNLYTRTALLSNTTDTLFDQDFFSEAGAILNITPIQIIFPIYLTDPFPGDKNFDFRWLWKINYRINF
jgi:hypothetical protein